MNIKRLLYFSSISGFILMFLSLILLLEKTAIERNPEDREVYVPPEGLPVAPDSDEAFASWEEDEVKPRHYEPYIPSKLRAKFDFRPKSDLLRYPPELSSQRRLVDNLKKRGVITSDRVYDALLAFDMSEEYGSDFEAVVGIQWGVSLEKDIYTLARLLQVMSNYETRKGITTMLIQAFLPLEVRLALFAASALESAAVKVVVIHYDQDDIVGFLKLNGGHLITKGNLEVVKLDEYVWAKGYPRKGPYQLIFVNEGYRGDDLIDQIDEDEAFLDSQGYLYRKTEMGKIVRDKSLD